ncbi:MAG: zinc-ribbon domain-containing protein, partial [Sphingomicrobium sp.]
MILTCPNCGTQYVVKDGAIPAGGRQVRCASCKHSWHENPEDGGIASSPATAELAAEAPEAVVAPASAESGFEGPVGEQPAAEEPVADDGEQSLAEATLIDPRSGPEAEERAFEEAAIKAADDSAVPVEEAIPATSEVEAHDDEFAPFPLEEDYSDERQRSPLLTIALIVIAVAVIAAAFWFFAPDAWKVRLGLAAAGASPLALVTTHMDRQRLQSGNE